MPDGGASLFAAIGTALQGAGGAVGIGTGTAGTVGAGSVGVATGAGSVGAGAAGSLGSAVLASGVPTAGLTTLEIAQLGIAGASVAGAGAQLLADKPKIEKPQAPSRDDAQREADLRSALYRRRGRSAALLTPGGAAGDRSSPNLGTTSLLGA